ncbi:MAG: HAD-IA family hydrolase [Planctomycetes bacterium]|nr:HAD-IA family hydrolase [Planctomycetota bacterium]
MGSGSPGWTRRARPERQPATRVRASPATTTCIHLGFDSILRVRFATISLGRKPMPIKALFVDVGNTLVREAPSRFAIYAEVARSRGVELGADQMAVVMRRAHGELPQRHAGAFRYTDPWFEAYIERIFAHHLGIERAALPELSRGLFARFSDPATFELFPGALELLDAARARGLTLGIVSNWSARLPPLLERLGVTTRVDFVLCSAIEELEKPDPAIFQRALERAGVAAGEALHAGDDLEKDVLGARRVGIRAVLVDHAGTRRDLSHPRAGSLPELRDQIERLSA